MELDPQFNSIEEALEDIQNGKMVIVVDDPERENEGDLILAAEKVTPEAINFMISFGRGLVCLPIVDSRLDELGIGTMVLDNTETQGTAFTVSVDASPKFGITTGISPSDRAATIKAILESATQPADISRPGHVFPIRYVEGGVLRRAGHTEAAVDLAKLAHLFPAGVICEIINADGSMARISDLFKFAEEHNLRIITIADLIKYRLKKERLVRRVTAAHLPTKFGDFIAYGYEDLIKGEHHVALVKGEVAGKNNILVRVHSQCLTGDVFGSLRCDCGDQLSTALRMIEKEKSGVILYMSQEGRGIGLLNKLKAYEIQEQGCDTVEANKILGFSADLRDYGIGAQILMDLGLTTIRLLTNNPRKIVGIEGYGLKVTERIPLETKPNVHNIEYLKTKSKKLGHLLSQLDFFS